MENEYENLIENYELVDGENNKISEIFHYIKGDNLDERISYGEYIGVAATMRLLDFVESGFNEAQVNGWEFWVGKNSYETYAFRNPETDEIEVFDIDD